jgi:hypothetical protein
LDKGIVVIPDFLSSSELQGLREEIQRRQSIGMFRAAGGYDTLL